MVTCRIHLAAVLAAAVCAAAALPAHAYEIYKWLDENGVVHYSDSAPEEAEADVAVLEFEPTNPPGYDPLDDFYSIERQAERIGAQWEAIAEEKAAREERERAAALEQRLAALERRGSDEPGESLYRQPNVFLPLVHRRFPDPYSVGHRQGIRDGQRPRAERPAPARDTRGRRPGWSGRGAAGESEAGFASPED